MATLLETVNEALTPERTTQISEMLGTDKTKVKEGVRNASALLVGALAHKAATDEGADQVLSSFDAEQDAPDNVFTAIDSGRSDAILYPLFGIGVTKVVHWIQNTTDQDLGSYLLIAAPLVLHAVSEKLQASTADAATLGELEIKILSQALRVVVGKGIGLSFPVDVAPSAPPLTGAQVTNGHEGDKTGHAEKVDAGTGQS